MLKEVVNTNIKSKVNTKICLISDIHYYRKYNIKIFDLIIKNIKENKPDYICISGDIIDIPDLKINELEGLKIFLENLSKITKVIMIPGNHDVTLKYKLYENKEYIDYFKKINNLYLLINEDVVFDNIRFIGYYDVFYKSFHSDKYYKKYIELIDDLLDKINIKDDKYNILLAHNPIYLVKDKVYKNIKDWKYLSLILSGHTHGGLLPNRLWGHRGIISPSKKIFPKNVRGNFNLDNVNLIISNGVVKLSHTSGFISKFNFLFPVSINYITINKE